jgi:hypothetical protein
MNTHSIHPLANIFPVLPSAELKALADDIRRVGQLEKIVTLNGAILDGRNRLKACEMAGVQPAFTEYAGGDPAAFVVSRNLCRRHLNESQRAIIAARLAGYSHDEQHAGGTTGELTVLKASRLFAVSERSIYHGRTVVRDGSPELVRLVEAGSIRVSKAAKLSRLPKKEQLKRKSSAQHAHPLLLSDGTSLNDLPFYDLQRRLGDAERDLALLRAVLNHAQPADDRQAVRDVVPAVVLAQIGARCSQ